jgi:hypothetical protein
MKTADVLRKLIRACVDDERTLQHERGFVDGGRGAALSRMARERQQFVQDLALLAVPGQSDPSGSWAELLREVGRNVQVAAAGRNSGDSIATCRRSLQRTEACYDRALQRSWPAEMQRVLESQQGLLHEEASELNRLQV